MHFDLIVIGSGPAGRRGAVQAAKLGADVATLPPDVLRKLVHHPLTEKGLAAFLEDWQKTGQSILAR